MKLVESARYQGRPAIVIIVSSGSGYLAWVVTPGWVASGCSATSRDVLARTTLPGNLRALGSVHWYASQMRG